MFRLLKRAPPIMLLAMVCAARAGAQATPATATLLNDRWYYPFNLTPGARATGALFITPDGGGFAFNLRDGMAVYQWQPVVPPALAGHPYKITKATISVWMTKDAAWAVGGTTPSGYPQRMELFAAGFGPSYAESDWNGSNAYIGGALSSGARDPYPRALGTNAHVEDVIGAAAPPWAVGVEQAGYVPGAMTDAVRVDFELDVDNPTILGELRSDIAGGKSTWVLSGVYETTGGPGGGSTTATPVAVMSEGVGNINYGTTQQAPKLVIEFEPSSAAKHWELFQ